MNPDLITCDFSPNLIAGITRVFGEEVIQIDLFHVMQELNRGIKADLLKYRKKQFDTERNELKELRDWVKKVQAEMKGGISCTKSLRSAPTLPELESTDGVSGLCRRFTSDVLDVLNISEPTRFFCELRSFIGDLDRTKKPVDYFCDRLLHAMPKKRFTEKGMRRVKKEVLKKLKTFYLHHRKPLTKKSLEFHHKHDVLFFQPENLNKKRRELLDSLLSAHPELNNYRRMTLMLGELSRAPPEEIDGHQIDELTPSPSFSKKLNTAIRTIKTHKSKILRFVEFSQNHQDFVKGQRANMEYYNTNFKEPFESGNNLLKKERLMGRLKTQFSGKIEWFLGEKAKT